MKARPSSPSYAAATRTARESIAAVSCALLSTSRRGLAQGSPTVAEKHSSLYNRRFSPTLPIRAPFDGGIMRFPSRVQALFLAITLGTAMPAVRAQQPAAPATPASAALTQEIPLDTAITTGKFKNGLTYFIRTTKRPEKRAELRLVVNAGSLLEKDDQRRPRALRRAHGVQRHEALPEERNPDIPGIAWHAVRAERQCVHELRRNRLHAAGPDRKGGRARSRLPDPRGLGARADVRPGRDRQGARRHHRGVAQPAGRGGPHAGQAAADHGPGIALRRRASRSAPWTTCSTSSPNG